MAELCPGKARSSHVSPYLQLRLHGYIALSAAAQESIWLKQLTSELTIPLTTSQFPFLKTTSPPSDDPQSPISRTFKTYRYQLSGDIKLMYCPSGDMTACRHIHKKDLYKLREFLPTQKQSRNSESLPL